MQVLRDYYMHQRYGEGKLHDKIIADMGKNMYTTGLMYFNISGLMTNSQVAAQYGINLAGVQTACNFGSADPVIIGGVLYTA